MYALSLPCIARMWFLKWGNCEKAVSFSAHKWHRYGFSPVCLRMCWLNMLEWAYVWSHTYIYVDGQTVQVGTYFQKLFFDIITWHWYGRSPECVRLCMVNCDWIGNRLPHCAQLYASVGLRFLLALLNVRIHVLQNVRSAVFGVNADKCRLKSISSTMFWKLLHKLVFGRSQV